jgi:hypothetical protein
MNATLRYRDETPVEAGEMKTMNFAIRASTSVSRRTKATVTGRGRDMRGMCLSTMGQYWVISLLLGPALLRL